MQPTCGLTISVYPVVEIHDKNKNLSTLYTTTKTIKGVKERKGVATLNRHAPT